MRNFPFLAALLSICLFAAAYASAGEIFLGRITSPDGGAWSNGNTDGGQAFVIPTNAKISVQCSEASYVGVSINPPIYVVSTTLPDAGIQLSGDGGYLVTADWGVKVPADSLFQTSTFNSTRASAFVSMMPVSAVADAGCKVFERRGNE